MYQPHDPYQNRLIGDDRAQQRLWEAEYLRYYRALPSALEGYAEFKEYVDSLQGEEKLPGYWSYITVGISDAATQSEEALFIKKFRKLATSKMIKGCAFVFERTGEDGEPIHLHAHMVAECSYRNAQVDQKVRGMFPEINSVAQKAIEVKAVTKPLHLHNAAVYICKDRPGDQIYRIAMGLKPREFGGAWDENYFLSL